MEHRCVKVDYANLMDAIGIAEKRGGRIRLFDHSAVRKFMEENHLDLNRVGVLQLQHGLPMATILASGLMKGLYFYSVDAREAWLCIATDRPFAELRPYDWLGLARSEKGRPVRRGTARSEPSTG